MFIARFNTNGMPLCATALASGGDDKNGVSADRFGNAYITSDFYANPFIVGSDTLNLTNISGENIFVAKFHCCATPTVTASSAVTICDGNPVVINVQGAINYLWSPATGLSCSTCSNASLNPHSTITYTITGSIASCIDTAVITITVNPKPIASTSGNITIFQGQTTTLTASGGESYLWNTSETTIAIEVVPNVTTIYCVTVADTNNCKDSICATVFIESPCDTAGTFFFPNAFSPNNDADNDVLKIYYRNMDCIASLHLVIYDRWGALVYETLDKNFSWDGTYPNKSLNTQVLAYHLTVGFTDGKAINRKGNVSLVR